jgi:hypothetical protein
VLGPITVRPVNQNDTVILSESLTKLASFSAFIGIDLQGSVLTLDSGFDSQINRKLL